MRGGNAAAVAAAVTATKAKTTATTIASEVPEGKGSVLRLDLPF